MKKKIRNIRKYILKKRDGLIVFIKQWILIIRMSVFSLPINKMYYRLVLRYKINTLLFNVKSFFFAFRYKVEFKTILKHSVIFCLVLSGCWYIVSLPSNKISAFMYAGLGFLFSLYATYVYEKAVKLNEEISYLPLTSQIVSSIYGITDATFLSFFEHPLDDTICKKGDNIIYINPCKAGGGYDEIRMMEYNRMMDSLGLDAFWKHFRPLQTRHLIKSLKEQSIYFNNTYSLVLNRKDSINKNLFILFTQFYQALNTFMFLDLLKWEDPQIKANVFIKTKLLINKTNCVLLLAQREMQKIRAYTEYIAYEPVNNEKKLLEGSKVVEQNIIEKTKMYFKEIQKFKKKEQEYIMNKFINIQNILGIKNNVLRDKTSKGNPND